jgi:hypothetical protein
MGRIQKAAEAVGHRRGRLDVERHFVVTARRSVDHHLRKVVGHSVVCGEGLEVVLVDGVLADDGD